MRKKEIILLSIILILVTASCLLCFFIIRKNAEDINKDIGSIHNEVLSLYEQLETIEEDIEEDTGQIQTQISNICSNNDESPDVEVTNRLLNKVLDKIDELRDIESYNLDRIRVLEKELIKQTSGAYNNYNFYYYDEENYNRDNSYSVRFLKDYLYETEDPIPPGEENEGTPGVLKIFLDKTNNEYISLFLWHSRGVSTTMKDIPVKYMYTNEGEVVEFVEYELDGIVSIDFGFVNQYLKVMTDFNEENASDNREAVMEIVKSIMFYDFNFER